jgi:hypothetical protein
LIKIVIYYIPIEVVLDGFLKECAAAGSDIAEAIPQDKVTI